MRKTWVSMYCVKCASCVITAADMNDRIAQKNIHVARRLASLVSIQKPICDKLLFSVALTPKRRRYVAARCDISGLEMNACGQRTCIAGLSGFKRFNVVPVIYLLPVECAKISRCRIERCFTA